MKWASICSGIGAPECAWHDIFGPPQFVAEIDAFPSAVLAQRFPGVPNLGDFTKIRAKHGPVDLLVGGTPCQSFSIAGKRAGLADSRGNLTLEYLALAKRLRARWLVWENVPGVLSDDGGRTLAAVFGVLGKLGYGWAYRVLDAQYWGLAQRRKRVFLVAHLGNGTAPRAVLFEPESLRGDPAPRRETGERPAPTVSARTSGGGGPGADFDLDGGLVPAVDHIPEISPALKARDYKGPSSDGDGDGAPLVTFNARQDPTPGADVAQPLDTDGYSQALAFTCKDSGQDASHANGGGQVAVASYALGSHAGAADGDQTNRSHAGGGPVGSNISEELAFTLRGGRTQNVATAPMAFDLAQITHRENRSQPKPDASAGTLAAESQPHVAISASVRRLTPLEWERLMGFPDGWTAVIYRGKPAADGPRYKSIGNAMAVPVLFWLGMRIKMVEEILNGRR